MATAGSIIEIAIGVLAFCGSVYALIRGLVKWQNATEANTAATVKNTAAVEKLEGKINDHGGRIRSLEDWRREGGSRQ